MEIYFIRHAQSTNNHLFETTGSTLGRSADPDLSRVGHDQLSRLHRYFRAEKEWLERQGFERIEIWSSPMIRAIRTAQSISEAVQIPIQLHPEIYEVGGIYLEDAETGAKVGHTGLKSGDARAIFPSLQLPDWVSSQGWWNRPHESWEEAVMRGNRVADQLRGEWFNFQSALVLVSHNAFFQCFLRGLLQQNWSREIWFQLNNASVSRCSIFENGRVDVTAINFISHLPISLRTL